MADLQLANPDDQSQPVPEIVHGAIPGLLGVMLSGKRGIGSDFGASGGLGLFSPQAGAPADAATPREGIGAYIRNSLGLPNLLSGAAQPTSPGRGIGSDYTASGGLAPAPDAPPSASPAGPPPMWSPDAPAMSQPPAGNASIGGPVPMPQPSPFAGSGDGVALPPNAAPAIGGAPPPAADNSAIPKDSLLGKLFSHLGDFRDQNRMTLLAMAGGLAGSQNWGTGLSKAFTAAVPAQRMDIAQNQQNMTAQTLMKRMPGLSQNDAMAIASNPAMMQQILPQVFGSKQRKFTQIGEDMMGNKRYGFVDEVSGTVHDLAGNPISQAQQGADIPNGPDGQPLSGEELRAHIAKSDPMTAAALKDMYEGKLNPNARNIQKLAPLASLVYPGFDATQYPVRLATRKSYTSGKDFQETQALNTVSGHMGRLMDSADKLDPSDWKFVNSMRNFWSDKISDNPNLVRFRNDLVTTKNELAKAYHGGHVSDSSYAAFNQAFGDNMTGTGMKAGIGEMAGLLHSKIQAKESGYRSSMGEAPLPEEYRAINDEAKHAFSRINDWANGIKPQGGAAAAPGAPQTSAAPPPGKYHYDPATGQMVRQQ